MTSDDPEESGEDAGDPFDELDPAPDRDADPFESLAEDGPGREETERPHPDEDPQLDDEPFSDAAEAVSDAAEEDSRPRADRGDPFADMDVGTAGDPFESGDWGADDADESVWEDLSTSGDPEPTTREEGGRRLSEVNKHSFCEQCEYFTGPPEIACTHDGTEILEFLDMETVRVADCPVVEERERLENAGSQG